MARGDGFFRSADIIPALKRPKLIFLPSRILHAIHVDTGNADARPDGLLSKIRSIMPHLRQGARLP